MRVVVRILVVGQQIVELAGRKATGSLPPAIEDGGHFGDTVQRPLEVREVRYSYMGIWTFLSLPKANTCI